MCVPPGLAVSLNWLGVLLDLLLVEGGNPHPLPCELLDFLPFDHRSRKPLVGLWVKPFISDELVWVKEVD